MDTSILTMQETIRAYDHPLRQQILKTLSAEPMSVNELSARLKIGQSLTSQHLRILREQRLVGRNFDGRVRQYYCNRDVINALKQGCKTFAQLQMNR